LGNKQLIISENLCVFPLILEDFSDSKARREHQCHSGLVGTKTFLYHLHLALTSPFSGKSHKITPHQLENQYSFC